MNNLLGAKLELDYFWLQREHLQLEVLVSSDQFQDAFGTEMHNTMRQLSWSACHWLPLVKAFMAKTKSGSSNSVPIHLILIGRNAGSSYD